MDNKTIIKSLLQENKKYWGKLLFQEYFELFQKIHSNELLAKMISQDLGFELNEKQIENVKVYYQKKVKSKQIQPQQSTNSDEEWAQNIYDKIYNQPKKTVFDLSGL
jgi:hypothetical protein